MIPGTANTQLCLFTITFYYDFDKASLYAYTPCTEKACSPLVRSVTFGSVIVDTHRCIKPNKHSSYLSSPGAESARHKTRYVSGMCQTGQMDIVGLFLTKVVFCIDELHV